MAKNNNVLTNQLPYIKTFVFEKHSAKDICFGYPKTDFYRSFDTPICALKVHWVLLSVNFPSGTQLSDCLYDIEQRETIFHSSLTLYSLPLKLIKWLMNTELQ